jgi:hypothetical protein
MSDPNRSAPPSSRPAPDAIDRREFLRLGLGTAVLLGCGDDPAGASDGSTGSTTTTDASSSSTGDPTTTATPTTTSETTGDPTTTGDSTTTTTTGDSTTTDPITTTEDPTTGDATTGEPAVCAGQPIAFDPAAIALDAALFPTAVMAGEMRPTSVMLAFFIAEPGAKTLRVWRSSEVPGEVDLIHETQVEPGVDGFLKVTVDELCPGTWYSYGLFVGEPDAFTARSLLGEFRTAIADDALEPLTLALASCNGSSLVWPTMTVTADEYYDMFIHLGDMAYNDGATSLAEFRASWRKYLGAEGYKLALSRAGLYATWDDHEIDNNSNFDRETMDPQQLAKRQNAFDTFFEALPIDAEGPDYQLWRSFRWGLTAEIIVLDCRYERRPSMQQYISPAQMAFLKERLLDQPLPLQDHHELRSAPQPRQQRLLRGDQRHRPADERAQQHRRDPRRQHVDRRQVHRQVIHRIHVAAQRIAIRAPPARSAAARAEADRRPDHPGEQADRLEDPEHRATVGAEGHQRRDLGPLAADQQQQARDQRRGRDQLEQRRAPPRPPPGSAAGRRPCPRSAARHVVA